MHWQKSLTSSSLSSEPSLHRQVAKFNIFCDFFFFFTIYFFAFFKITCVTLVVNSGIQFLQHLSQVHWQVHLWFFFIDKVVFDVAAGACFLWSGSGRCGNCWCPESRWPGPQRTSAWKFSFIQFLQQQQLNVKTTSLMMGKKKSTATSAYLYHIPCHLMQVLLDLWIFRLLASLLGVFHLIIQQIKT